MNLALNLANVAKAARGRALAVATAIVLAACGGGGSGGNPDPDPAPTTFQLTVAVTGSGTVASVASGINCGTVCSATVTAGTNVTLTAEAAPGQVLQAWGGACSGQAATCTVTMDAARSVTATFAPINRALDVAVTGSGVVSSQPAGIDCGSTCSSNFANGATVILTAAPTAGHMLQGWGGVCSGQAATCTVTMDAPRTVTATFASIPPTMFTLDVAVTGSGAVSSQPAGITCGSSCSASFSAGTSVALTATPAAGQTLSTWGGACSGQASICTVTMDAARSVTATFAAAPPSARTWAGAALLENNNDFNISFGNEGPLSAIDANGNALVMWEQSDGTPDGSTRKIYSRRYVSSQGWAAATTMPNVLVNSGAIALDGRLLVDGAGNFTWVDTTLSARRYSPSTGWAASAIAVAGAGFGSLADAKIDASGTIHALRQGGGTVTYGFLAAGANQWSDWVAVAGATTAVTGGVRLALASLGAIAIWYERNPGDANDSLWANRMQGTTWQGRVRIEEALTNVRGAPAIAVDANGNALAAWHQGDSLYVNRFDAASVSWGTAQEFDARQVGSSSNARVSVVMHADGRAVIGWNSGIFALKTMTYTPGAGFATPVTVVPYSIDRTMHMDGQGRVVVVHIADLGFPTATTPETELYAHELPWGGAWTAGQRLDGLTGDVRARPSFAMNLAGQGVTAFAQNDIAGVSSPRNSLWANVRR